MKFLGLSEKTVDIGVKPHHISQVLSWGGRQWTPDISRLEKYRTQLLFVYDEHMSDRRQHFVIEEDIVEWQGRPCRVSAFTQQKFNYVTNNGVCLPFPDEEGKIIRGEILVVTSNAFMKLDKLKQNGVQFFRIRVPILDPYRPYRKLNNGLFDDEGFELPPLLEGRKYWLGEEHIHIHKCWMYFPKTEYWRYQLQRAPFMFERVSSFSPRKDKTWLSEYYKFQNENP